MSRADELFELKMQAEADEQIALEELQEDPDNATVQAAWNSARENVKSLHSQYLDALGHAHAAAGV